jgi:hypothetical protein
MVAERKEMESTLNEAMNLRSSNSIQVRAQLKGASNIERILQLREAF